MYNQLNIPVKDLWRTLFHSDMFNKLQSNTDFIRGKLEEILLLVLRKIEADSTNPNKIHSDSPLIEIDSMTQLSYSESLMTTLINSIIQTSHRDLPIHKETIANEFTRRSSLLKTTRNLILSALKSEGEIEESRREFLTLFDETGSMKVIQRDTEKFTIEQLYTVLGSVIEKLGEYYNKTPTKNIVNIAIPANCSRIIVNHEKDVKIIKTAIVQPPRMRNVLFYENSFEILIPFTVFLMSFREKDNINTLVDTRVFSIYSADPNMKLDGEIRFTNFFMPNVHSINGDIKKNRLTILSSNNGAPCAGSMLSSTKAEITTNLSISQLAERYITAFWTSRFNKDLSNSDINLHDKEDFKIWEQISLTNAPVIALNKLFNEMLTSIRKFDSSLEELLELLP